MARNDRAETRPDVREHDRTATVSLFGRSYCYITCPFCRTDCRAYIWSLAGGGKRCPRCKAMHTSMGTTINDQPECNCGTNAGCSIHNPPKETLDGKE